MGKTATFPGESDEDKLLVSRVEDACRAACRDYRPRFVGFLDRHQQAVASRVLKSEESEIGGELFWGGFDGAERAFLGVFPPYAQPETASFPVRAFRFTWKFGELTHRDFLGSLMSLGIRREKIGDIVLSDKSCNVIVEQSIGDFILQNLTRVGGAGVAGEETPPDAIEKKQDFAPISDTIASPRLDCVVAALCNVSRGGAERLIVNGSVSVDFTAEADTSRKVSGGSTVSIRGHGRFIIDSIGPETRKGRLRFEARKYL